MSQDMASALWKVGVGALGTFTASLPSFSPEITTPYIGVPFNVVIACIAGAYSSFSFGDKVEPRSKMWKLFIACVFMGAAWTGTVNFIISVLTNWQLLPGAQAGMGAIISCLTRFVMPAIIENIKPWIASIKFRIPFLSKKD